MLHYFMKELYYRDGYWQILQIDLGYNFLLWKLTYILYLLMLKRPHNALISFCLYFSFSTGLQKLHKYLRFLEDK